MNQSIGSSQKCFWKSVIAKKLSKFFEHIFPIILTRLFSVLEEEEWKKQFQSDSRVPISRPLDSRLNIKLPVSEKFEIFWKTKFFLRPLYEKIHRIFVTFLIVEY